MHYTAKYCIGLQGIQPQESSSLVTPCSSQTQTMQFHPAGNQAGSTCEWRGDGRDFSQLACVLGALPLFIPKMRLHAVLDISYTNTQLHILYQVLPRATSNLLPQPKTPRFSGTCNVNLVVIPQKRLLHSIRRQVTLLCSDSKVLEKLKIVLRFDCEDYLTIIIFTHF